MTEWEGTAEVVVPDFVGLEFHDAKITASRTQLFLLFSDPDHPPQGMCFVAEQEPKAGETVPNWSAITVSVEDGPEEPGVSESIEPSPSRGDDPLALTDDPHT